MKALTRTLFATAVLFAFVTLSAKASNTEDRHLSGFTAISLTASYDVYITQGSAESVKVQAANEDQSHIITEVRGNTLNISEKRTMGLHLNWTNKKVAIYVVARDINSIVVTGSGDVYFKGGLNTERLNLRVAGSGDVTGKLNAKMLDAGISGSGDVKLSGKADEASVHVTGSGDYNGRDLNTVNTVIGVAGSGDATVNASNKIQASVSGSGDIKYTGSAKQVSTSKTGSGDIERI